MLIRQNNNHILKALNAFKNNLNVAKKILYKLQEDQFKERKYQIYIENTLRKV